MSIVIVITGKFLNLYTLHKSRGVLLKPAEAQGPTLAIAERTARGASELLEGDRPNPNFTNNSLAPLAVFVLLRRLVLAILVLLQVLVISVKSCSLLDLINSKPLTT